MHLYDQVSIIAYSGISNLVGMMFQRISARIWCNAQPSKSCWCCTVPHRTDTRQSGLLIPIVKWISNVFRSWSIVSWNMLSQDNELNSLTVIDAHERQRFNELHGTIVSRRIFIRSQSLIARWTRNDLILAAVAHNLYEACRIDDVSRGSKSYLFWAS